MTAKNPEVIYRARNRVVPALLSLTAFLGFSMGTHAQVSVLTAHNDNNRSGQNLQETQLSVSNVNVAGFGKLFSLNVDGDIYAQALYVPNLNVAGKQRNVLYVATEHNTVYAFDADDSSAVTLWSVNLGGSVPSGDICGGAAGCYEDLVPEIGITATPVIDPLNNLIFVVAKNKDQDGSYHFRLHALDLVSGAEMLGGPVAITANGFGPFWHLNRPALLLSNGTLYVAFGSVGDFSPWHGWIMAYNARTLQQTAVLNTNPDGSGGSIWAGGQGPVVDSAGNIYVMTANGSFTANTGGNDYSTSFLKLDPSTLSVLDYFTPDNQSYLGGNTDVDLGAGGPVLIPGTHLLLGGGKDGVLRLVDTSNMGKFNPTFNADVQEWQATPNPIMNAPVYWNSSVLGPVAYLFGPGDSLKAWAFNGTQFQTSPVSQSSILNAVGGVNMAALSISADNSRAGTGIVWASSPQQGDANRQTTPGILRAFDADDLTRELWDSQQNATRDSAGNYAKFNPPTVVGGKVYLTTFSNVVNVYGLFSPPDFSLSVSPGSATASAGQPQSYTVSVAPQNGFSATVTLQCSVAPAGGTCSFSPSQVAPGSAASLTVNISNKSATRIPLWLPLALPGLAFVVCSGRKRQWVALLIGFMLVLVLAQMACGGGSGSSPVTPPSTGGGGGGTGGPPPAPSSSTYTITITGQSGALQHSAQTSLTIQ